MQSIAKPPNSHESGYKTHRTMTPATFRLVLLVSCCHALVHVYEHSFASVEQLVGTEFGVGKEVTGPIGSSLRLPFGLFALAAGWLADHWGARRLLLAYLAGCSAAAMLAWFSPGLAVVFAAMFTLGTFASIYHPAGVGLISHHTVPENRPMALGYHGILGSAGIAAGPFLAAIALNLGVDWRGYYLLLSLPGLLLAGLLFFVLPRDDRRSAAGAGPMAPAAPGDDNEHWTSFWTLSAMTSLAGIVYAAILTFLPRYLNETGVSLAGVGPESMRNYQAGFVLLLGIIGQYAAGRIGRPTTLEPLIALVFGLAVPCVVWMGFAQGPSRLAAAGLFAVFFFAHQPLYNSAVAKYVPRRTRSRAYGLSFTLGFGVGSIGPTVAGMIHQDQVLYPTLAGVLAAAALLAAVLWRWHRPVPAELRPEEPLGDEEALI